MNAYLDAMRKYATFSGRATRSQFWIFTLIFFIAICIAAVLDVSLGTTVSGGGIISTIVSLVHLLPAISVYVRRLHDTDRSGWWYWFNLVPIVGPIVMLVFLCTRSTAGANRFGPAA
ncbi:MAG: DUF805 domain-containing protein [Rhizobiaceae bacterium]|nr:DUF805 domain-containing protein [Rhizobiaceae bacterium]